MKCLYDIWVLEQKRLPFIVREPITGTQVVVKKYDWVNDKFIGLVYSNLFTVAIPLDAKRKDWRFIEEIAFTNRKLENVKRLNFG